MTDISPPVSAPDGPPASTIAASSRSWWLGDIERSARTLAYAIPVIYGLGFVIVSVNLWSHGIAHVEPVKPRAFSAGALFIGLTSLCVFLGRPVALPSEPRFPTVLEIAKGFLGSFAAFFASVALYTFFGVRPGWITSWTHVAILVVGVASVTAGAWLSRRTDRWRFAGGALTIAAVVGLIAAAASSAAPSRNVGIWCASVAGLSAFRAWLLPSARSDVSSTIIQIAGLLTTYATAVYPAFAPAWGGGAPVKATFEVRDQDRTRVEEVMILDETPHGFYLRTDDGEATLFLPRESVKSMVIPRPGRPIQP